MPNDHWWHKKLLLISFMQNCPCSTNSFIILGAAFDFFKLRPQSLPEFSIYFVPGLSCWQFCQNVAALFKENKRGREREIKQSLFLTCFYQQISFKIFFRNNIRANLEILTNSLLQINFRVVMALNSVT